MKTKINEIHNFIYGYVIEDGQIEQTDDFEGIVGLIDYVNKKFDCNIEIQRAGEFDSPGFDLQAYAWAGIIWSAIL